MKMKRYFSLAAIFLILNGCSKNELLQPFKGSEDAECKLLVVAAMPEEKSQTRVTMKRNATEKTLVVKWADGDKVNCFFKEKDKNPVSGGEISVSHINEDGKQASFFVKVPESIKKPYSIYFVHGAEAEIQGAKISINVSPTRFQNIENAASIPLLGKVEVSSTEIGNINMKHLGAIHSIYLSNYSSSKSINTSVGLAYTGDSWFYSAGSTFDAISETVSEGNNAPTNPENVAIPALSDVEFVQWVMPNGKTPPAIQLIVGSVLSVNSKPARQAALVKGKAYNLYGIWNNGKVMFDELPVLPIQYVSYYNVNESRNGFAISHDNDKCGGLFPQYTALSYLNSVDWEGREWHLPSKDEIACLVSTRVYYGKAQDERDSKEVIQIVNDKKTYSSDYFSSGNGVCYALRLKQSNTALNPSAPAAPDNSLLCAYRYEKVGEFTEGNTKSGLKISVCYLGEMFEGTVNDIANESWWATRKNKGKGYFERIIPMCGYKADGGSTLFSMGTGGYINSSSTHKGVNNWTRAYVMAFGRSGCSLIGEQNPGVKCAVRLFCNTPLQ